ncbi:MAG TPA: LytTR family DNA-binding domain-containing protein [Caldimonas sp.]|jgi:two-component system LytT family response regulator|nr:LytTR family DNA-binding domain-containing protein [Caldimonas sp.]HEX2539674.1 LytTR family DNA-binding domain-containing protein [Caldimonas sp.]
MNRHRTLIAEDEPLAREGLADWVRQLPELELVGACADGHEALRAIRELAPALVLMDIQMPGLTGLQVLRSLAADRPAAAVPAVIFTTAYDEHAVAAFELHAVDYLLKPFSQERFEDAVRHALQAAGPGERTLPALEAASAPATQPLTRLLVRDQGKIFPLLVDAIEYLRSDTKYTAIVSKGRHYLVRLPLAEFERRLDPQRFLKISRSCIVNLDCVVAMVPNENSQLAVQLQDGTRIVASRDVSRQLRADLL